MNRLGIIKKGYTLGDKTVRETASPCAAVEEAKFSGISEIIIVIDNNNNNDKFNLYSAIS